MQLGMIGLGRMGGNIVRRLLRDGHTAVVYDPPFGTMLDQDPSCDPSRFTVRALRNGDRTCQW
jgi:nucleoside-diphosphate-sugar epimerase